MVAQYHCWIFEHKKDENVETFRSFIIREAEFQIAGSKAVHGLHLKKKKIQKQTLLLPLFILHINCHNFLLHITEMKNLQGAMKLGTQNNNSGVQKLPPKQTAIKAN